TEDELAQVARGRDHVRRPARVEVAQDAQRQRREARLPLELFERAAPETPAARPLERGIRGQLDDERLPSESRTERAAPEHPGRVDDVVLACPVVDERGAAVVADARRETARYRAQRIRARLRRCVG